MQRATGIQDCDMSQFRTAGLVAHARTRDTYPTLRATSKTTRLAWMLPATTEGRDESPSGDSRVRPVVWRLIHTQELQGGAAQRSPPGSRAITYFTARRKPDVVQISSMCETVLKSKETSPNTGRGGVDQSMLTHEGDAHTSNSRDARAIESID
jgi:hypothetical protein